jgi:hypothetical protein
MITRKEYSVTLRFQFPAWDEKSGIEFRVSTTSKRDAIAAARHLAERDGHVPARGKGRATFTAIAEV